VLKVSEQSPNTHHFLAELFRRAGLPPGVLNVIQTRREDAAAVTEAVIAHRYIRKVEFIGSAAVGSRIASLAGKYLKPTLMELGGKAAALVLADADLQLAAQGCVHGGYMHSGQICFSTERIIVNRAIAEQFIPILTKAAANFRPMEHISEVGSNNTLRMLKDATSKGAQVIYGEVKLLGPTKLQPVILTGLTSEMEIYDNESFGPVLALYIVDSDEEAIDLANSTKYGLSAGVYSRDIARALKVASRLEVGQTHINFPLGTGMDEATLGIGLSKASGWVKQNGSYGLDEFLELRTVTVTDPAEFAAGMAQAQAQDSS
jgi:acyl-CoA reductase-like NAD-dependent aldehyde dehydrogenase